MIACIPAALSKVCASLVPRLSVGGAHQEPGYEARFAHKEIEGYGKCCLQS